MEHVLVVLLSRLAAGRCFTKPRRRRCHKACQRARPPLRGRRCVGPTPNHRLHWEHQLPARQPVDVRRPFDARLVDTQKRSRAGPVAQWLPSGATQWRYPVALPSGAAQWCCPVVLPSRPFSAAWRGAASPPPRGGSEPCQDLRSARSSGGSSAVISLTCNTCARGYACTRGRVRGLCDCRHPRRPHSPPSSPRAP